MSFEKIQLRNSHHANISHGKISYSTKNLFAFRGGSNNIISLKRNHSNNTFQNRPKTTSLFAKKKNCNSNSSVSISSISKNNINQNSNRRKLKMYISCVAIVLLWISAGTIFYSSYNHWPLAQSFFYAVDAGMSIGFCTDVAETSIGSRAFTIVYILLGASSVGGALALFIQDIMEGAVELRNCEFELILAKDAFDRYDTDHDGKVSIMEFRNLIQDWVGYELTYVQFKTLCEKFDASQKGYVTSKMFFKRIPEIEYLLEIEGPLYSKNVIIRKVTELKETLSRPFTYHNRIFAACLAWISMGIIWGVKRMKWDIITATHFAVSALATGGLTAPSVNKDGILPREPAIFCGIFCLIGIPLFGLTLAHFARILVESHVVAETKRAIFRPLSRKELDYAKSLCTPEDELIHLSDFIVLQLLRMGKVNKDTIELIKTQFKALDVDGTGGLPASNVKQKNRMSKKSRN